MLRDFVRQGMSGRVSRNQAQRVVSPAGVALVSASLEVLRAMHGRAASKADEAMVASHMEFLDDGGFRCTLPMSDDWFVAWTVTDQRLELRVRQPGHDQWTAYGFEISDSRTTV